MEWQTVVQMGKLLVHMWGERMAAQKGKMLVEIKGKPMAVWREPTMD